MIIGIIQARMKSTRLPGKVLKKINGKTLLEYQIARLKYSKYMNDIVIATSHEPEDDEIELFCKNLNINCYRGSHEDLLERYYLCARKFLADTIVRITADCPLVDYKVVDELIITYLENNFDYVSNTTPPETSTFPDGSDVEIFSFTVLESAYNEVTDTLFREHVTFQFWQEEKYKSKQIKKNKNDSDLRITVDYIEDFVLIRKLIIELQVDKNYVDLDKIIKHLRSNKSLRKINSKYYFGIGWNKN